MVYVDVVCLACGSQLARTWLHSLGIAPVSDCTVAFAHNTHAAQVTLEATRQ